MGLSFHIFAAQIYLSPLFNVWLLYETFLSRFFVPDFLSFFFFCHSYISHRVLNSVLTLFLTGRKTSSIKICYIYYFLFKLFLFSFCLFTTMIMSFATLSISFILPFFSPRTWVTFILNGPTCHKKFCSWIFQTFNYTSNPFLNLRKLFV